MLQYIQGLLLNKMENWRGQELECTHPEIYFMNGTNIERLQQNVGAPLLIHRKSQERVDNMCLISSSLGAIYSREGRKFSCDIFPLGAFSRRGELLLKPKAFSYGISLLFLSYFFMSLFIS